MSPIKIFLSAIALYVGTVNAKADNILDSLSLKARVGYSIGGTAPVSLPATIRGINEYRLQPNFCMGVDAKNTLDPNWSMLIGLRFESKGMHVDARVKNYYEEIVKGNESLAGRFTGDVTTQVRLWMMTIPLQAVWSPTPKIDVRCGPYVSMLTSKSFTGYVHNGYLRVGDPTGAKVELGNDEEARGNYDFTEHLRPLQWGLNFGVDWTLYRRFGIFADISWGLTGVHKKDFKTIEQTLYPIFGTLGATYRL